MHNMDCDEKEWRVHVLKVGTGVRSASELYGEVGPLVEGIP